MDRPNILLLITDQQRRPMHWPDEPGWVDELMPNLAELARTGLSFNRGFCNSAMCSPSRATLFTGRYPAEHGVKLTLTAADLKPDPRNTPGVIAEMGRILSRKEVPPGRVLTQFARGALGIGLSTGGETELPIETPNLPRLLRARGYDVAYKGKWHLTHPLGGEDSMLGGWSQRDAERLERDYGFADWEAPDAGENAKAANFGGGIAADGKGWDEVYTRQVESWLTRPQLPEPFCMVASLVNPHDVLGYPASYLAGGYSTDDFRDLGVLLPPTIDECMAEKPSAHALMRMGMAAYLGPLKTRRQQLDYVNFYAYLHRVIDEKIGRIIGALGDPDDPGSLRSRTIVVRCADHGEMGLSHGGLRQKAFNAYEESISVPLVISNPVLFPKPQETEALGSLVDVLPTLLDVAGDSERARRHGRRPARSQPGADHGREGRPRARARRALAGRPRPGARSRRAGRDRPGRRPFHLRRPSGGDGAHRGSRAAQPGPRHPHRDPQVRLLLRSAGRAAQRVRDVRPAARSRRGP